MASTVKNEEDQARLVCGAAGSGVPDGDGEDGGASSSSSSDDDDEGDIDVEGDGGDGGDGEGGDGVSTAEEREKRRLVAHNLAPAESREKEGDVEVSAAAAASAGGGDRQRTRRRRAETLGERVLKATSQCQACLYDIAMVPCKVLCVYTQTGVEGAWRVNLARSPCMWRVGRLHSPVVSQNVRKQDAEKQRFEH